MFSCISDAGNFSYRWPSEKHRAFKKFLTEIDTWYLMRKIEPRSEVFDFEKTVSNLKKELFLARQNRDIDKQETRKTYRAIETLEHENSPDLIIYQLITNTEFFSDDYSWTAGLIVKEHTPGAITFTEIVFPLFQEALKAELEVQP